MFRACACVVSFLALPAVAAADPIPVTGVLEKTSENGASVRVDRGATHHPSTGQMGGYSYGSADGSDPLRGLLYADNRTLGPGLAPTISTDRIDTSNLGSGSAASGMFASTLPGNAGGSSVAPASAASPGQSVTPAQVLKAFRDALGPVTSAGIETSQLAPIVGAMEATDVLPVGGGGTTGVFGEPGLVPEVHASEPATLILFGSGLLALAHRQRSKRRAMRP